MKNYIILFCIFVLPNTLAAQTNQPLPDTNAVWILETYSWGPPPNYYTVYFTWTDTLIGGNTYVKLFSTDPVLPIPQPLTGCYHGAYRCDTLGRVYYVQADSSLEHTLFDFSKNVGDSIFNSIEGQFSYCDHSTYYYNGVVQSVTFDTVNNKLYKRMLISYGGATIYWLEGVGSAQGGVFPRNSSWTGLYCMSYNDTIYYHGVLNQSFVFTYDYCYSSGTCDSSSLITGSNSIEKIENISVFPTIVTSGLTLEFANTLPYHTVVNIVNSIGQIIKEFKIDPVPRVELDLSLLSYGLYMIIIKDDNGIRKSTKIIKSK